jgi:hypothetical protein
LIDLLHDDFENSGLVDWVKIAEHGMRWLPRVNDCGALLMAVAGQASDGALWGLADRLGALRGPFVSLCTDVSDMPRAEFLAKLLDLVTHGEQRCDNEDCEHCHERVLQ